MQKILIVEDNLTNLKLFSRILKKSSYEVFEAGAADAGIAIAREVMPDLILMDIQLPGMDGLTAANILKKDPKTKKIPVVALTAHVMKGDDEKILAGGCDGYISKPIRYKEFLSTVKEFLKEESEVTSHE